MKIYPNSPAMNGAIRSNRSTVTKERDHSASEKNDETQATHLILGSELHTQPEGGLSILRGAQEAISLAKLAEDSLSEVYSILEHMRDIGKKKPVLSGEARESAQQRLESLGAKLDQIAQTAVENHCELMGCEPNRLPVPDSESLGIRGLNFADGSFAGDGLSAIDKALEMVEQQQVSLTNLQERMKYSIDTLTVSSENVNASQLALENSEKAKEMLSYIKSNLAAGPRDFSRFHSPLNLKVLDLIGD